MPCDSYSVLHGYDFRSARGERGMLTCPVHKGLDTPGSHLLTTTGILDRNSSHCSGRRLLPSQLLQVDPEP